LKFIVSAHVGKCINFFISNKRDTCGSGGRKLKKLTQKLVFTSVGRNRLIEFSKLDNCCIFDLILKINKTIFTNENIVVEN